MENKEETPSIGRNEPCPCGSGKKHKRCCGVNAAPKLTLPKPVSEDGAQGGPGGNPAFDPKMLENMDPQWMAQVSKSIQRLPKGQLQRLQSLMQKAMHGKDVTAEASELEKTLPPEFQTMMQAWGATMGGMDGAGGIGGAAGMTGAADGGQSSLPSPNSSLPAAPMTEEEARRLVAEAAKAGVISSKKADALLTPAGGDSNSQTPTGLTSASETPAAPKVGFWNRFKKE